MRLRFALPFIVLFLFAARAHAADIGECATPEAMTAKLKAEDQRSVASAQLITEDKRLFGMIFTMSTDRKVGYIIKADQPLGDRASQLCIYNRLADIRLFDARKPGTPPGVLLKAPEADAERRCDELAREGKVQRGACGSLNTLLRRVEGFGERVVMQGRLVRKGPNGTFEPDGTLATVLGRNGGSINDYADNPARGIIGSILYTSLPDGASVHNATLVYVENTEFALSLIAGR